MRRQLDGLWDRMATDGPITGSGPGFERAMRLFRNRQKQLGLPGRWRKGPSKFKKNNGTYIDRDWDFVDY